MSSFDCLIVCAHPDDAFLGMGGTIRNLIQKKKSVLIVCATNGENGDTNLGEIRKKELACSCNMLGCEFLTLQLKDGELYYHAHELYFSVADLLIQNNPQYIFTHHSKDRHSDHLAVYTAVSHAAEKLWHIPDLLQFPIPVPSPRRSTPLEVHATSYLAASVRILSLSYNVISVCILSVISFSRPSVRIPNICSIQILAHMFDFFNCFRQKIPPPVYPLTVFLSGYGILHTVFLIHTL